MCPVRARHRRWVHLSTGAGVSSPWQPSERDFCDPHFTDETTKSLQRQLDFISNVLLQTGTYFLPPEHLTSFHRVFGQLPVTKMFISHTRELRLENWGP